MDGEIRGNLDDTSVSKISPRNPSLDHFRFADHPLAPRLALCAELDPSLQKSQGCRIFSALGTMLWC